MRHLPTHLPSLCLCSLSCESVLAPTEAAAPFLTGVLATVCLVGFFVLTVLVMPVDFPVGFAGFCPGVCRAAVFAFADEFAGTIWLSPKRREREVGPAVARCGGFFGTRDGDGTAGLS